MKINPYYIAAAVAVAVIVIIFVSRRDNATRDWKSTNFILSADDQGNLTPISEDFFEQKETDLLGKVNTELGKVNTAIGKVNTAIGTLNTKVNNVYTKKVVNDKLVAERNSMYNWIKGAGHLISFNQNISGKQDKSMVASINDVDKRITAAKTVIKTALEAGRNDVPSNWNGHDALDKYTAKARSLI